MRNDICKYFKAVNSYKITRKDLTYIAILSIYTICVGMISAIL